MMKISLIGGTGRCGTTILKRIFQKHPDAATVPEWRISVDPDGLLDFYTSVINLWTPQVFDVGLKRLEKTLLAAGKKQLFLKLVRLGLRKLKIEQNAPIKLMPPYSDISIENLCPAYRLHVRTLIDQLKMFTFKGDWVGSPWLSKYSMHYGEPFDILELQECLRKFLQSVIMDILQKQDRSIFLEDNTWNILWFDRMLQILPEAKLVHIYRDPRDVVASFCKQTWAPSDPVEAATYYLGIIKRWWQVRKNIPQSTYHEISLEALVHQKEKILRGLCDFWEISWHHDLLLTDLSKAHSGRYKKEFSVSQIEKIETILAEPLKELGYS